jgi:hypothetical protein
VVARKFNSCCSISHDVNIHGGFRAGRGNIPEARDATVIRWIGKGPLCSALIGGEVVGAEVY